MPIFEILIGFLSAWFMMHGMMIVFGKYYASGTVWGCNFKGKGDGLYPLMIVLGFFLLILGFIWMTQDEDFDIFIFFGAYFLGIGFSFFSWIMARNKCYASDHISSAVANVAFMPDLERCAAQCHHFVLTADGIAFYDETNYCLDQIVFADYQIGNVPNGQMTFACYALAQKFHGVFTCHISGNRNIGYDYEFRRK